MTTEWGKELVGTLYYRKKLKWYQKIWYFITRKKNKYEKLNICGGIDYENND